MKRLRIEFGGEALDSLRVDTKSPRAEGLTRSKVFEISSRHFCQPLSRVPRQNGDSGGLILDTPMVVRTCGIVMSIVKTDMPPKKRSSTMSVCEPATAEVVEPRGMVIFIEKPL